MSIPPDGDGCAVCQKKVSLPALLCFECSEGTDIHGTTTRTTYCTSRCRDADQNAHRVECEKKNTRKHIYRAGDLLQAVFYLSRDRNYDSKIIRTEKKEELLRFHVEGWYKGNETFQTSPYKLGLDAKDAHGIMGYFQCDMALTCFYQFIKKLLKGVSKYIEEAAFCASSTLFTVQMVFPFGGVYPDSGLPTHQVLFVETHGGESYAIDLSGAQFGQYKPVLPLQEAITWYSKDIPLVWPHGHYYVDTVAKLKKDLASTEGPLRRGHLTQVFFANLFDNRIAGWENDQGVPIDSFMSSTRKEYESCKEKVLRMVIEGVKEGAAVLNRNPDLTKLIDKLEWPASVVDQVNKCVTPAIMNNYPGSKIGKACIEHLMAEIKKQDVEMWEKMWAPYFAAGGKKIVDVQCHPDQIIDRKLPYALATRKKDGSYSKVEGRTEDQR